MKQMLLLMISVTHLNLSSEAQQVFELRGTVPNTLEGKTVFISNKFTDYSKREIPLEDSCIIRNGAFLFKGRLKNAAALVSLYLKRPHLGIKQFFLEGRETTITFYTSSKPNLLDTCVFLNAPVNMQQQELESAKSDFNKKMIAFSTREQKEYKGVSDSVKKSFGNEYRLLKKEENDIVLDFIKLHPDYYVSLFWLCYQLNERLMANPDSALAVYNRLSYGLRVLPEADTLLVHITNKLMLSRNHMLPEFLINDFTGKPIRGSDFQGRYLLIDFWASWCGPCIMDLPRIKELYRQLNGKNFAVLGVSLDDNKSDWETSLQRHKLPWTQVSELRGWRSPFAEKLDIRYIPQYYLVAPDGRLALMGVSFDEVQTYLSSVFKPGHP
jgi:thiol-disulfide isomerase/thioredoxin